MYIYQIPKMALRSRARYRGTAILVILALFCVVTVPLVLTSLRLSEVRKIEDCITREIDTSQSDWKTEIVVARGEGNAYSAQVTVVGEPPFPTQDELPNDLTERCDVDKVQLRFSPLLEYVL